MKKEQRKTIELQIRAFDFEDTVLNVIEQLKEFEQKYPGSFIREGYLPHDDDRRPILYWKRPETDSEMSARLKVEAEQIRRQEEREKAEFIRLSLKFKD